MDEMARLYVDRGMTRQDFIPYSPSEPDTPCHMSVILL